MTGMRLAGLMGLLLVMTTPARALDPYAGIDPWWVLLHEPAVVAPASIREFCAIWGCGADASEAAD